MGSRLALIATLIAVVLASSGVVEAQSARNRRLAKQLFKNGLSEFKKGHYEDAIDAFQRSYKLNPTSDALFAQAQAQRLNDNCPQAITLYEKLLNQSGHIENEQIIRDNLAICTKPIEDAKREAEEAAEAARREREAADARRQAGDEKLQVAHEKRVVEARAEGVARGKGARSADRISYMLIAAGGLGLGVASGFFVASNSTRDAAADANNYEVYLELRDRADLQRTVSFGVGAVGLGLVGFGLFRLMTSSDPEAPPASNAAVSMVPHHDGALLSFSGSF